MIQKINCSADAYKVLSAPLADKEAEEIYLVCLGAEFDVRAVHFLARGGVDSVRLSAREVARMALSDDACGVILAHNHPSGTLYPSKEDIKETARLNDALHGIDISLVDHIIVTKDGYFSFADGKEVRV